MSLLGGIAKARRLDDQDQLERTLATRAIEVSRVFRDFQDRPDRHLEIQLILKSELTISEARSTQLRKYTPEEWTYIITKAHNSVFGSPMSYANSVFQQHTTLYQNPTHHVLRVEALGLVEQVEQIEPCDPPPPYSLVAPGVEFVINHDGQWSKRTKVKQIIKTIPPNGIISIPDTMIKGGSKSVVNSVCPQLRKVDIVPVLLNMLDATPLSHAEWVTHYISRTSQCCRAHCLWSSLDQHIVCSKCKEKISFVY